MQSLEIARDEEPSNGTNADDLLENLHNSLLSSHTLHAQLSKDKSPSIVSLKAPLLELNNLVVSSVKAVENWLDGATSLIAFAEKRGNAPNHDSEMDVETDDDFLSQVNDTFVTRPLVNTLQEMLLEGSCTWMCVCPSQSWSMSGCRFQRSLDDLRGTARPSTGMHGCSYDNTCDTEREEEQHEFEHCYGCVKKGTDCRTAYLQIVYFRYRRRTIFHSLYRHGLICNSCGIRLR